MKTTVDYTLYNQIKAKFPAQPNTVLFVSITSENIEDLVSVSFTEETAAELQQCVNEHWDDLKPYAAIGHFDEKYAKFLFVCHEYLQEEEYKTGKIKEFEIGAFRKSEFNLEAVRADLAKLGKLLFGNSKAS